MTGYDQQPGEKAGLVLYVKPGCHLCEEAWDILEAGFPTLKIALRDITGKAELTEKFGVRIPVLERTDTKATLDWPFGPRAVAELLTGSLEPEERSG